MHVVFTAVCSVNKPLTRPRLSSTLLLHIHRRHSIFGDVCVSWPFISSRPFGPSLLLGQSDVVASTYFCCQVRVQIRRYRPMDQQQ